MRYKKIHRKSCPLTYMRYGGLFRIYLSYYYFYEPKCYGVIDLLPMKSNMCFNAILLSFSQPYVSRDAM